MNWLQKINQSDHAGDCFSAAAKWAADNDAEVVHGMVTDIGHGGKRIWHAWAEKDGQVIDVTTLGPDRPMEQQKWYDMLEAEVTARYRWDQALINVVKHKHWGPW